MFMRELMALMQNSNATMYMFIFIYKIFTFTNLLGSKVDKTIILLLCFVCFIYCKCRDCLNKSNTY